MSIVTLRLAVVAEVLLILPISAQQRLEGVIADQSGRPVKGVLVTVHQGSYSTQGHTDVIPIIAPPKAIGAIVFADPNAVDVHYVNIHHTKTDGNGHYAFRKLSSGIYAFSARGMKLDRGAYSATESENTLSVDRKLQGAYSFPDWEQIMVKSGGTMVKNITLYPANHSPGQSVTSQQPNLRPTAIKPTDGGPSLTETMMLIQETLGSVGRMNDVVYSHVQTTGYEWSVQRSYEIRDVRADVQSCGLYYHVWVSVNGRMFLDKDFALGLRDATDIAVLAQAQSLAMEDALQGHPDWITRVEPPSFFVVKANRWSDVFPFRDEASARSFAEALVRAIKLCRGGR
jgi:hypothetical protein